MNKKDIWFRRKSYGWGWTPATKEGWGVTLVFILAIVILAVRIEENMQLKEIGLKYLLPVAVLTLAFIKVAYTHGEKPKWQWGDGERKKLTFEEVIKMLKEKG
jgi:hypothetical protein